MLPRVRVIGSLNIDFTTTTRRFPGPGETVSAKSLSISPGGKGANQAVACGRASHTTATTPASESKSHDHGHKHRNVEVEVEMVGAIGAEGAGQFSALMKPVLEEAGIDSSWGIQELAGSQTGTATIIVDEADGGQNRILVVPGANYDGMKDVDRVLERALQHPLPEMFVLQGEIPQETTFALLRAIPEAAGKAGKMVEIILNPAPVYQAGIPVDCLKHISHLIVNESEMGHLAVEAGNKYAAGETEEQKRDALRLAALSFHQCSVSTVVITRGAEGVFCSTLDGSFHLEAVYVPDVADTTAAGDTFVGYYAVELAKRNQGSNQQTATEQSLKQACCRATLAAAKCVTRQGAIRSIPWGYEI